MLPLTLIHLHTYNYTFCITNDASIKMCFNDDADNDVKYSACKSKLNTLKFLFIFFFDLPSQVFLCCSMYLFLMIYDEMIMTA